MIRILPFILIPVLILGGLMVWRSVSSKPVPFDSAVSVDQTAVEVPKTLPGATTDERITSLESALSKLIPQVNSLKTSGSLANTSSQDAKISSLESDVTDLKARVSALEKAAPAAAPASTSQSPLYIPVGAGGGPWLYADWTSLNEYQVSINSNDYTGYSSMQLEVNFRLVGAPGTGYVRLYNATDGSAVTSEISTTSTSFGIVTSGAFKLTSGQKLYTIQAKSTESKDLYIQSARIKVNF